MRLTGVHEMSEVLALIATWGPDDPPETRVLSGGRPGELQMRGYNVTEGFLHDPEATRAAFTGDG
jgi:long-subunit acyl-CoA synthetase (AMP-forming)